jgi:hypothetical protein
MKSHLDLLPLKKMVQNPLMAGAVKPNQISEIEREEDLLDGRDFREYLDLLSNTMDQFEISFQSTFLFREKMEKCFGKRMKAVGMETNLKSRINVSNVLNRDKFHFLMNVQFLANSVKLSTRLASPHKCTRGIKLESAPFEGDHIASHLVLFFKEESFTSLLSKKGRSGQAPHPGPDDNRIVSH